MNKIVIAGAGTFGTSVAERLAWNNENKVYLHTIEEEVAEDIQKMHRNTKYFPTRYINRSIEATVDYDVFKDADVILLVIPSKAIVPFSNQVREHCQGEPLVVNLAKGMSDDGAFITEKIPFSRRASMKGPSFAIETLNGYPTSFTFGGSRKDYEYFKNRILPDTGFSIDYTDDIKAVELLSILKNMYAIAIGIVSGRYNSPNVDFLVYTKAVNEMKNLLKLFSCGEDAIFCYCGIGDLGLTSLNDLSRNRTFGMLIGKGFSYDEKGGATVIEGKRTVRIMGEKVIKEGLENVFPVVTALYKLIYADYSLNEYIMDVLK